MSIGFNQYEYDLIRSCLTNNRLAQRELYEKYSRSMFTLAFRITANIEDAEEVLQDGFISVFRNLGQFKMESSLGAWIRTIITRAALKKIRKKGTEEIIIEELVDNEYTIDWGDSPIDVSHLEDAIQQLSDGYRTVFILSEIEGYSQKEISDLLNVSVGTIKSQLFRAKKLLQKKLETKFG